MDLILIGSVIGTTSLVAYLIARQPMRLSTRTLRVAVEKTLESVGMMLIFFVVNITLATAAIIALRGAGIFVSVYGIGDIVWVILTLLQGVAFQWWRELARSVVGAESPRFPRGSCE